MYKTIVSQDGLKISARGGHGFFSSCTKILQSILLFVQEYKILPKHLDFSEMFGVYKRGLDQNIFNSCFKVKNSPNISLAINCKFTAASQQKPYKNLNFSILTEYVNAYFEPTELIQNIITELEKEHSIDYRNTCAVYYRGTDKITETKIASYDEYFQKAREILEENPNIRFLVQTDEEDFQHEFQKHFTNCFTFEQLSIFSTKRNSQGRPLGAPRRRTNHVFYFLSAVIIMSKAEHVILPSSNGGLWIALYRNNTNRVHQYLQRKIKNPRNAKIHRRRRGWL